MNSWRHDNLSSKQPSYIYSSYGYGDYLLQDASFIRFKNITVGYTLPLVKSESFLQKVRFYFDAQNPFIITKYSGIDPETDVYVAAYPNVRTYAIGLEVIF
jgi:hypothetical protein